MNLNSIDDRQLVKHFTGKNVKTIKGSRLDWIKHNGRFFDIKETAIYLHISAKTIRNQLSLKTFPIKAKRYGKKKVLFEIVDVVRYANSL